MSEREHSQDTDFKAVSDGDGFRMICQRHPDKKPKVMMNSAGLLWLKCEEEDRNK